MAMNKRGVFFTASAILLVGLAVIAFVILKGEPITGHAVQTRILTLDNFLKDAQSDLDRAVRIATIRTLVDFESEIINSGTYIDDVLAAYPIAILNGTYQNASLPLVGNATLTSWESRVSQKAAEIGINLNVTFGGTNIRHSSPWDVLATVNATFIVSDNTGLARFNNDYTSTADINIIGLEDPLYIINSGGIITNIINQTIYEFGGDEDNNNEIEEEEFLDHSKKGYYIAHSDAPDYLMRLEGNLGSSSNGIESLVYLQKFIDNSITIKQKTIVDYLYFSNQSVADCYIDDLPSWFRIDYPHHDTYGIEADEGECELID